MVILEVPLGMVILEVTASPCPTEFSPLHVRPSEGLVKESLLVLISPSLPPNC